MTISCKTAPRAPGLAQYRPGGGALRALTSRAPPLAGLGCRWAIEDSNLGPLPYQAWAPFSLYRGAVAHSANPRHRPRQRVRLLGVWPSAASKQLPGLRAVRSAL